jgi:PAS domain-containing protein
MLKRGDDLDEVKAYLRDVNTVAFKEKMRMFEYNTIYGYFDAYDEFYDGSGWKEPSDYVSQERPWFIAAERNGGRVAMTTPFIDAITATPIIAYARRLYNDAGQPVGVVSLDVSMEYIRDLVSDINITENSYAILIDNSMQTLVHPDFSLVGVDIRENNVGVSQHSHLVEQGLNITRLKATNFQGVNSLLFGRRIDNGWYLVIVIAEAEYYQDLYQMILIVSLLGIFAATMLIFMLKRLEEAKKKSDEENRIKSAQLAKIEKERAVDEYMQLIMDATPLAFNLWTREFKNIVTNEEATKMFNLSSKEEYLNRFGELSPELQPCGSPSGNKAAFYVKEAFDEGYSRFEWMHQTLAGEEIPTEVTLVRVKHGDDFVVAGYTRDLREHKALLAQLKEREEKIAQQENELEMALQAATEVYDAMKLEENDF